jgi:pyridoxal phosphate enzyme (YggS family)
MVLEADVKDIGESRVQDALLKYRKIGEKAVWHLVGHLQTNKVRDAVKIFSLIHSVDSLRLAAEIDKEARKAGKVQDVLIQVNTSGETAKFGISAGEVAEILQKASSYPNINILGLMAIAPEHKDAGMTRSCFRTLREVRDRMNGSRILNRGLRILSMGMTNDFEVAIEEGSNMVRIGRAIFGAQ